MAQNKEFLKFHDKKYLSTAELAKFLGVSRVAVFKKIKSGQIKAEKIGRNYIIPKEELAAILGLFVPERRKKEIDEVVRRAVKEYGSALRLLGKE